MGKNVLGERGSIPTGSTINVGHDLKLGIFYESNRVKCKRPRIRQTNFFSRGHTLVPGTLE